MSAEIIPFPMLASASWRNIRQYYPTARDKAGYAERILQGNRDRMERLGVSPDQISAEMENIESLLATLPSAPSKPKRKAAR